MHARQICYWLSPQLNGYFSSYFKNSNEIKGHDVSLALPPFEDPVTGIEYNKKELDSILFIQHKYRLHVDYSKVRRRQSDAAFFIQSKFKLYMLRKIRRLRHILQLQTTRD